MNTAREASLLGVRGATDLHVAMRTRATAEAQGAPIDVFGTIRTLGVPLLFRPLKNLLGACIRVDGGGAGIIITTERGLHLQRFTAAHELGHFALEHEGSLDREVGLATTVNRDLREVAADAFAAEFLLPKWLVIQHAKLRGWTRERLTDPHVVYQLSLRVGVSYDATCLALQTHKILDNGTVAQLQAVSPKKLKQALLGSIELENWWPQVWQLDRHDDGQVLEAGPDDVFVANLVEHSGAGYLWDTSAVAKAGFSIVKDEAISEPPDSVGSDAKRRIFMRGPAPGVHQLSLIEQRPWEDQSASLESIGITISSFGREAVGVPRRERPPAEQHALH